MSEGTAPTSSGGDALRRVLVAVAVAVGLSLLTTVVVTLAVWPGEARLTAPLFCDDEHPDAFVVADHETAVGETTTDYTLYCVGPRGGAVEVGWRDPFLALTAAHALLWLLVLTPVFLLRRRGAR